MKFTKHLMSETLSLAESALAQSELIVLTNVKGIEIIWSYRKYLNYIYFNPKDLKISNEIKSIDG